MGNDGFLKALWIVLSSDQCLAAAPEYLMAWLSLEIDGVDDEEDIMQKEVGRSSEKLLRIYRMKTVKCNSRLSK